MSQFKYGALPARIPFGLSTLGTYAVGKLPQPPASVDAPSGVDWGMDLNSTIGDCTIAGVDHLLAAWNAKYDEIDARPTDATIQSTYFALTGGQDTGLVEADVLKKWQTTGLFKNTIEAYAPVHPTNIVELHQAIAFYGGAYLGIACPASAQQQFADGQPWTYVPGSPIEGGHCIDAIGYTPTALLCVTWGAVVEVTYSFMAHYASEAWAIISHELVQRGEDNFKIDLASLKADLATV